MMVLEFEIRPVTFADDVKSVEVILGDYSVTYSYTSEEDKKRRIEQAAKELLQMIQKPATLKAGWGADNVECYGSAI